MAHLPDLANTPKPHTEPAPPRNASPQDTSQPFLVDTMPVSIDLANGYSSYFYREGRDATMQYSQAVVPWHSNPSFGSNMNPRLVPVGSKVIAGTDIPAERTRLMRPNPGVRALQTRPETVGYGEGSTQPPSPTRRMSGVDLKFA